MAAAAIFLGLFYGKTVAKLQLAKLRQRNKGIHFRGKIQIPIEIKIKNASNTNLEFFPQLQLEIVRFEPFLFYLGTVDNLHDSHGP